MDGRSYTTIWEGNRLSAYQDDRGNWTIGIGHKLGFGDWHELVWTQTQVDQQFANDYGYAVSAAAKDLGDICWNSLNDVRQAVITDMAFNLGENKLAAFHKMISALLIGDWQNAAAEIMNSDRAKELPRRSQSNADLIVSGEWPNG